MNGILLLALGHHNYGLMALNMAVSIKKVSPNMPIHLVYHGDAINYIGDRLRFFDAYSPIPQEHIWLNGEIQYFKAKTHLYDLTPFDITLYLDADMVWCRKPVESAFEELKDVDFTIANRGEETISETTKWLWGNPQDFKNLHPVLPNYHSEFVYFKKCDTVANYFHQVKDVYQNPPIAYKTFAGGLADEYAFTIASVRTGVRPHTVPFVPTYWMFVDKIKYGINYEKIFDSFYCFSVGGSAYSRQMKEFYDRAVKANAQIMQAGHAWTLHTKRSFLPQRHTL